MLDNFISSKEIIVMITNNPNTIADLPTKKQDTCQSYKLSDEEWQSLDVLKYTLKPFKTATVALSARDYPTIGMSYIIIKALSSFVNHDHKKFVITISKKNTNLFESVLNNLKEKLDYYLERNGFMTEFTKRISLVCSFKNKF
jgi:hypothetical protein